MQKSGRKNRNFRHACKRHNDVLYCFRGDCMEKTVKSINIVGEPKVYEIVTDSWSRPQFAVRGHDGLSLFVAGKIEYHFAGGSVVAQVGDVMVLPGNIPYSGTSLTDGVASFIVVDFDCDDPTAFASLSLPTVISTERYGGIRQKFRDCLQTYNAWQLTSPFKVKGLVYSLIADLMEAGSDKVSDVTTEILQYISANLSNPDLRVGGICGRFFISESQLRRNVQKATGMNPTAYITSLRLERAAAELRWSDRAVKDIALAAGFDDPYYFSNCFTRRFSLSPTAYRQQHGKMI